MTQPGERLLHVMWSMGIGGAERALYQLAVAQKASGVDVGVLVAGQPGLYAERLVQDGVELLALGQKRAIDAAGASRARDVFREWDIVHFHVPEPLLMLAAAMTPTRRYFTHRAGMFDYPLSRKIRYAAVGAIIRKRFDGVVGNTRHAAYVASRLFRLGTRPVGVVYNGIDWDILRPAKEAADVYRELALDGNPIVLGTSGNLRDIKRIDLVLRALSMASTDVTFVVVGDGPSRKGLEQLATDLGLRPRVRFVGSRTNVADYLQIFDAFVLASGPEESFGNSAVEAMGFGIPTIVFADGGGLVEHVEHGKTGAIAMGAADLAHWIDTLAGDASLRAAIAAAGKASVRSRYTLARMVEGYDGLYASAGPLLGEHS